MSSLRWGTDGSVLACIANFAGAAARGLPGRACRKSGRWEEVINTDADIYAGSGVGNLGAVEAVPVPHHGQPASVTLRVPPLATCGCVERLSPSNG